jgi:SAM-dependent methyltransferase
LNQTAEILSIELLDQHRSLVEALKRLAASLGLEFGWHYLLDLTWIISQLGEIKKKHILDAGAGTGLLQWYLAQNGAEVISVDRMSRADLPLRFRSRFQVQGLRPGDLLPASQVVGHNIGIHAEGRLPLPPIKKTLFRLRDVYYLAKRPSAPGRVMIYNQDLANLQHISDNSLDAVVAVSALEHNTPEGLQSVVKEILRVLKPGGALLATLCAGKDEDWWHAPSSGWCYTDASLRRLFDLPPDTPSNYARYDELLASLRNCAELRDNLSSFYKQSDQNGMPWGVWDPQYQPVGVCKIK